jgi:hypothetical protein
MARFAAHKTDGLSEGVRERSGFFAAFGSNLANALEDGGWVIGAHAPWVRGPVG